MTPTQFRALVVRYYRAHGRHDLPWRQTRDLYRILVSEVMLQQTQVERVMPFYTHFIKQFPTAKKLAAAPLSEVLRAWQGLGYNRRAKRLHHAAKVLSEKKVGKSDFPSSLVELEQLPGVGPYTARAIATFAYNLETVVIETNIRTAIIHHFFSHNEIVSDKEIAKVLQRVMPDPAQLKPSEWYSALMDYGAHLKRSGISYNTRSVGYTRQKKFAGSLREVRGALVRALTRGQATRVQLAKLFDSTRATQIDRALSALILEKMIEKRGVRYSLID